MSAGTLGRVARSEERAQWVGVAGISVPADLREAPVKLLVRKQ